MFQPSRVAAPKPNLYYYPVPRLIPSYTQHDNRQFDNPLTKTTETKTIQNEHYTIKSTD